MSKSAVRQSIARDHHATRLCVLSENRIRKINEVASVFLSIKINLPHTTSRQPSQAIIMNPNQKPKVCRQLFPSDEPSNNDYQKAIEESLQKHLEEQQKKYNFDIKEEKMIAEDGTYIWTKADGDRYDWIGIPNTEREEEETTPKNEDQRNKNCNNVESDVLENGTIEKDDIK